ncbi:MFS transporter [Sneathiella sp. P13V-1]|uniref:MFS transporter n=1 Tax=Sneathiella sp. P13V-1 TaxID=2697366 RepID=UPI00187B42C9|nr:MFS transporter [Sneathiella sp. P13V-1]MBE7636873.1 MFS transporter [Sneathiella sp. P13V-1]
MNLSPSERFRVLAAIIAAITIMAFALSSSIPLVSLMLEKRGVGNDVIGLMGAIPALTFLFFSPVIPKLAERIGAGILLWTALIGCSLSILLLAYTEALITWFILRLFIGLCMAILFLISETWLNQIALEKTRGRTVALYVAFMTSGFAAGPLLINQVGTDGNMGFIIAACIVAGGGFFFALIGKNYPKLQGHSSFSIISFFRLAPLISAAALYVAFFDGSIMTLLPVYGVKVGMAAEVAVLMTSVLLAGNILLQVPIGWLADHFGRIKVIFICSAIGLAGACSLPWLIETQYILWPVLIVWGGAVVGSYTLALVIMGQRFKNAELVTANAATGVLWGVGSLIGPAAAGYSMELYEPHGMPVTFIAVSIAFLVIAYVELHKDRIRCVAELKG